MAKWTNSDVVFDTLVPPLTRRILRKAHNFGAKETKVNRVGRQHGQSAGTRELEKEGKVGNGKLVRTSIFKHRKKAAMSPPLPWGSAVQVIMPRGYRSPARGVVPREPCLLW